jgi:dihydrofolate reductase
VLFGDDGKQRPQPDVTVEIISMRNKKQVIARTVTDAQWREVDRYRIELEFDPDAVRRLKGDARRDITVNGPKLAAHALRAGLVDELQMFVCPAVVGAGKRFFPDRVR